MAGDRPQAATATVLFTDLVGSTELRTRIGDVEADRLVRRHEESLGRVVELHGGKVVKGLGDGIMAVFDAAAAALGAAVAIQQRVGRDDPALSVRVGISAGDITSDGSDYHGSPVVEASRLCAAAKGGQVLCADVVRLLARGRSDHALEPVGDLELKGLPEPLTSHQVVWEAEPSVEIVLPPMLRIGSPLTFVGRESELAALRDAWEHVRGGQRRLVLVSGEPGAGKTRLVLEFARWVAVEGAPVLAGRCDEEFGAPYQPFVEALAHVIAHSEPTHLRDALGRFSGDLIRLVPSLEEHALSLSDPFRSSDVDAERFRLFEAVAQWLAATTALGPALLVLDDLHWASKPTLMMLRHLLRAEPLPLLVLGTYRDTDVARTHPFAHTLADLQREGGFERIVLRGLDADALLELFRRMTEGQGSELDDRASRLAEILAAETEGNPFFVSQLLVHLFETGAIYEQDGYYTTDSDVERMPLPQGIRDVVGQRLSRLSHAANQVLRTAAVAGMSFEVAVVEHATTEGGQEHGALDCLAEAEAAGIIETVPGEPGRCRFTHALARQVLAEEVPTLRRAQLHRAVAEALEHVHADDLDPYFSDLAYHFVEAVGAGDAEPARRYAERAGEQALAGHAPEAAVIHFQTALDLAAHDEDRSRLLLALGTAQRDAGSPAHRETLLEAARLANERGDTEVLIGAALANTRGFFAAVGSVDDERVRMLEEALAALPPEPTRIRARLLATLAAEITWSSDDDRRSSLITEAEATARQVGDRATLANVLLQSQSVMWRPDMMAPCDALSREALEAARDVGDPTLLYRACRNRVGPLLVAGELVEAEATWHEQSEIAQQLRRPYERWEAAFARISFVCVSGRLADIESHVDEVIALGESAGQPDTELIVLAAMGAVWRAQGRYEELRRRRERVLVRTSALAEYAEMCCRVGRHHEARELLDELSQPDAVPTDSTTTLALRRIASLCVCLDDPGPSADLYERALPWRDQFIAAGAHFLGSVETLLGTFATLLERFDAADEHFAAATAALERIGAPWFLAETRLERARMLARRRGPGDADEARRMIELAVAWADSEGAAGLADDAAAVAKML